jgi:hypothetical protein
MPDDPAAAAPNNDPSPKPTVECRVFERHPCELPGRCQPAASLGQGAEPPWSATVVDISRGGIRLQIRRRFERGSILTFELTGVSARQCCTAVGKVVHVRTHADGEWVMGCQFCAPLSDEELKGLLSATKGALPAALDRPAVANRREAVQRLVKLPSRRRS